MSRRELQVELRAIAMTLLGIGFFVLAGSIATKSVIMFIGAAAIMLVAACYDHAAENVR